MRLGFDLPGFLRKPMSEKLARRMVKSRLQHRGANLIHLLDQAVFSRPGATYHRLFQAADLNREQVHRLVDELGVEAALQRLDEAGVHLTFDEFKGRTSIERPGLSIPPDQIDLHNPLAPGHFATETGGSTGPGTRLLLDLEHRHQQSANFYLARQAQGLIGVTACVWRPSLPAVSGIGTLLMWNKIGNRIDRWFIPALDGFSRPSISNRALTSYLFIAGKIFDTPMPKPEPLRLDQAHVVAEWAADTVASEQRAFVGTSTSMAVRISLAAQEQGISLEGVVFAGGGESPSEAKVKQITASGATLRPSYFLTEAGALGMHCGDPLEINDQHFFSDCFALQTKETPLPTGDGTVNAFTISSLLSSTPRVMINVQIDDYGMVEERQCGCVLGDIGLTTHVRRVQSYAKLTGEGMSLVGSDMVRIIHEVLPGKLGGSALDYQLEERQDEEGFTRLVLRISPRVSLSSPQLAVDTVLQNLSELDQGSRLAGALWDQAGSFTVERSEPVWTDAGKLPALIKHHSHRDRVGEAHADDANHQHKEGG